jgi:hypothetical protein
MGSRVASSALALVACLAPFGYLACGGSGAESPPARTAGNTPEGEAPPVQAPPAASASWSPASTPDASKARRWAWSAIGCWIGGAWSEALGALGDERPLSTAKRCRVVAVEALGAKLEDEAALAAVRGVDAQAADRTAWAIEQAAGDAKEGRELAALVRAVAPAAREAIAARRAGEILRRDLAAKDAAKVGSDLESGAGALGAKDALATLDGTTTPALGPAAKGIAAILAADRLETARGLEPRAKVVAAAPAFEVLFGVARPQGPFKAGDWLAYVTAAAKAAGHAVDESNATTHEREQAAFAGVAAGLADRLEETGRALEAGEAKEVVAGYAKHLRADLASAEAKAKSKADAKKTAEGAAEPEDPKEPKGAPPKPGAGKPAAKPK